MQERDPYNVGADGVAQWSYLDIADIHIDRDTLDAIQNLVAEGGADIMLPIVYPYEYGFFMPVCPEKDADPETEATYPECIKEIFAFARARKCALVRVDADGTETPGLTCYEPDDD